MSKDLLVAPVTKATRLQEDLPTLPAGVDLTTMSDFDACRLLAHLADAAWLRKHYTAEMYYRELLSKRKGETLDYTNLAGWPDI